MAYLQALQGTSSILIREKVNLLEAASAMLGQEIEQANKYSIEDKLTGQQLFYAVEQTDCFTMQLKQCCGDCAAWKVDILYTGLGGAEKVMSMERPWTCTCCCFNRPTVTLADGMGNELGSITDPCNCCGMDLKAEGGGKTLFHVVGGCCQWGVFCPMPCGPCSKVEYGLQDDSGGGIGLLTKKVPGCLKFLFSPDTDNYILDFSDSQVWMDPQNKAFMIATALFMDFRYFSNNSNDGGGGPMDGMTDGMFGGE